MRKIRFVILTFIIIVIIICSNALYSINNYADPIVAEDDTIDTELQEELDLDELYTFDYDYKKDYIRYCTEYAILYSRADYLTEDELIEFAKKIDNGIIAIENYLGINLNSDHYINSRVFVSIDGSMDDPEFNNENINIEHTSLISVDNVRENTSSYIHELTHIIAWDCSSLWIKEGLAVYLNDKLNGDPTYPNNGCDIDKLSLEFYNSGTLESLTAFDLVGKNGVPNYIDYNSEPIFYIYSASFVKYLEYSIGKDNLIKIYKSLNTKEALKDITGKDINILKNDWINSITTVIE